MNILKRASGWKVGYRWKFVKFSVRKSFRDWRRSQEGVSDYDESLSEEEILEIKKKERIQALHDTDPRYNYFAPLPLLPEEWEGITDEERYYKQMKLARQEYLNTWYNDFRPKKYAKHHAKVIEQHLERISKYEEPKDDFLEWDNVNALKEHMVGVSNKVNVEDVKHWASTLQTSFLEFLRGYSEGKTEEEKKGPVKEGDFKDSFNNFR